MLQQLVDAFMDLMCPAVTIVSLAGSTSSLLTPAVQPGSCDFLRSHLQLLAGCLAAVFRAPAQASLLQQLVDAFLDPHVLLRHSPGSVQLCQVRRHKAYQATADTALAA